MKEIEIEVVQEKEIANKNLEITKLDIEINLIEMTKDSTGKNLPVEESMTEAEQDQDSGDQCQELDPDHSQVKPDL